jgi:hypothetical protein
MAALNCASAIVQRGWEGSDSTTPTSLAQSIELALAPAEPLLVVLPLFEFEHALMLSASTRPTPATAKLLNFMSYSLRIGPVPGI